MFHVKHFLFPFCYKKYICKCKYILQGFKLHVLGLEEQYTEYLGNKVVCHSIPIRPGRNLAVICESAAVNHRQKKMGYNAAQELYRRVQENIGKAMAEK